MVFIFHHRLSYLQCSHYPQFPKRLIHIINIPHNGVRHLIHIIHFSHKGVRHHKRHHIHKKTITFLVKVMAIRLDTLVHFFFCINHTHWVSTDERSSWYVLVDKCSCGNNCSVTDNYAREYGGIGAN